MWSNDIFKENLQYYVQKSGRTQKEIAEIIGVSAPTMNEWIKGKKLPRMDKVEKLANYFGILKSDLIERKKEPTAEDKLSQTKSDLIKIIDELSETEAAVLLASLQSTLQK